MIVKGLWTCGLSKVLPLSSALSIAHPKDILLLECNMQSTVSVAILLTSMGKILMVAMIHAVYLQRSPIWCVGTLGETVFTLLLAVSRQLPHHKSQLAQQVLPQFFHLPLKMDTLVATLIPGIGPWRFMLSGMLPQPNVLSIVLTMDILTPACNMDNIAFAAFPLINMVKILMGAMTNAAILQMSRTWLVEILGATVCTRLVLKASWDSSIVERKCHCFVDCDFLCLRRVFANACWRFK